MARLDLRRLRTDILSPWRDRVRLFFGRPILFVLFIGCALLSASCASTGGARTDDRDQRYAERCQGPPRAALSDVALPRKRPVSAQSTPVEGFSRESLVFAELLDIGPLIGRIPLTETEAEEKRVGAALRLMTLRQEIMQAILLATLETSSFSVEVRCEQARADRLADEMEKAADQRYVRLTVTSILMTAATSIVTGGFTLVGEAIADGVVAITGGALGGLFGGLALWDSGKHQFHHRRNHLKDIWEEPDRSELFPEVIWKFMNRRGSGSDGKSLREQLIDDWKGKGRLGDQNSEEENKHITLLFGEGGDYSSKDLRARTEMLDELGITIDLFYEELERFARETMKRRPITLE